MNLKGAFVWSVLIHVGFFGLAPPQAAAPLLRTVHSLEVVLVPGVPETFTAPFAAAPAVSKPLPRLITPPAATALAVVMPSAAATPPAPTPSPSLTAKLESRAALSVAVAEGGVQEGEFASLAHRKQVREHLKNFLRYPSRAPGGASGAASDSGSRAPEGKVRFSIRLAADGRLQEARVVETSASDLDGFCLEGVRGAAPYPSFPKEMTRSEVDYEFLVWYRPEG